MSKKGPTNNANYEVLAEGSGIASGNKKFGKQILKKKLENKFEFSLAYYNPRLPMSVQKKFQPNRSSRLAGYTHIYMNVLFSY